MEAAWDAAEDLSSNSVSYASTTDNKASLFGVNFSASVSGLSYEGG